MTYKYYEQNEKHTKWRISIKCTDISYGEIVAVDVYQRGKSPILHNIHFVPEIQDGYLILKGPKVQDLPVTHNKKKLNQFRIRNTASSDGTLDKYLLDFSVEENEEGNYEINQ